MLTFTLLVTLLYPAGEMREFTFGSALTHAQCDRAAATAASQLEQTLSVATVFTIRCEAELST